jgi:hypothetical protein
MNYKKLIQKFLLESSRIVKAIVSGVSLWVFLNLGIILIGVYIDEFIILSGWISILILLFTSIFFWFESRNNTLLIEKEIEKQ